MANEQTESGRQLIEALATAGFAVRVAFWAKPTDEGRWILYLASPVVDDRGPAASYRLVHDTLRKIPDPGIDPLEIRVVGLKDSLTEAALAATKPKVPGDSSSIRNPIHSPALTRFGGSTLGGLSIDGAYIYTPQPGTPA
jgi:hypothetical protein